MSGYDEYHPTWAIVALILATGVGYLFFLCLTFFATL